VKYIEPSMELKKTHAELKQRVEERTTEAVKANELLRREIEKRKRAEEALRESEEKYRSMMEAMNDPVYICSNDYRVIYMNPAMIRWIGTSDIEGIPCYKLIHGLDEKCQQCVHDKIQKGEHSVTDLISPKDGRVYHISHSPVFHTDKSVSKMTIFRDITERRLQEFAIPEDTERLRNENIRLSSSIKERYRFGDIIGKSRPMQEIYELILKAANSDANVVIDGESGTGKEMVARAIHDMSNRRDKVFVAVNCGAIPETLLESEFFGYKRGAFTGANMDKHGYLDLAEGGTLFLDEVGEIDLNLQVKLLRVIDSRGYTPVGSNKTKYSDFRIIAATNKNLVEQVNKNLMREDFFYRIHVILLTVPPLRQRKEDIPLLVEHFLKLHCNGKDRQSLPVKIFEALYSHDWPGNVRELENVLKRYFTIQRLDFVNSHRPHKANKANDYLMRESVGLRDAVELFEKNYITKVLEQNCWHRGKAAKMLGIPERTLYRKLKQFKLTVS